MIEEIKNFLTEEECKQLIEISIKEIQSCVDNNGSFMKMHPIEIKNYDSEIFKKIKKFISNKTNLPIENQENIIAIRYDQGGTYAEHYDSFLKPVDNSIFTKQFYEQSMSSGGQRKYTVIIYLNDDFSGGDTYFLKLNKKIKPEKGKFVYWNNLDENGDTNLNMMHAGTAVLSNYKWILVCYIRENKYENKCQ